MTKSADSVRALLEFTLSPLVIRDYAENYKELSVRGYEKHLVDMVQVVTASVEKRRNASGEERYADIPIVFYMQGFKGCHVTYDFVADEIIYVYLEIDESMNQLVMEKLRYISKAPRIVEIQSNTTTRYSKHNGEEA